MSARAIAMAWTCSIAALCLGVARAGPWLAAGDETLRSDIELLADAGILKGPVTTWPLSWPDIARDALAANAESLDSATLGALLRVQRRSRAAMARGFGGMRAVVSGAERPTELRGFVTTPRDDGELAVQGDWMWEHVAVNLSAAFIIDPDDGKDVRADGSYVAFNAGNVALTAGFIDRWWGPGWEGSLIYSNNARPMPSITLSRNYSAPFESRWLAWIGPWTATLSMAEAENSGVAVDGIRVAAARVAFKPKQWLEFGVSRTAQWCGEGRPCGWDSVVDLILGRDNQVEDGSVADQPGNQMAGYDVRLRSPWRRLPLVLYSQWIGEDEAGALPSKFLGQFGLETWASTPEGALRVHLEYSDTACSFSRETPNFDCAYRNSLYPQGYTYRGRVIGHAMDNDSRMYSVGAMLVRESGAAFVLTVKRAEINRDGGVHTISELPLDRDIVELRYAREWDWGRLRVGMGFEKDSAPRSDTNASGFLVWQQGF